MKKGILLINNGYPSECYPEYTAYIRSMEECIIASGQRVEKLVIRFDRPITPANKFYKYIRFWLKCLTIASACHTVYVNHLPFAWPLVLNPFIGKKRLIVHWHGNDLVGKGKFVRITNRMLAPFVGKAHNIVPSHYFSRKLKSRFKNTGKSVLVSPSGGIDTALFSAERKPHNDFTIGFASALTAEKGADTLIYLIEHKDEIESATGRRVCFNIIDYGMEAAYYVDKIKQTASHCCKLHNRMDKKQIPSFYQSADLLVFPSLRESESLGLAALEAMSCGVPVVAHNHCAFPEYIKPGVSGELVELCDCRPQQNRAFLDAVVKAVRNIDSYQPRRIVEADYSKTSVVDFYRNLFDKL